MVPIICKCKGQMYMFCCILLCFLCLCFSVCVSGCEGIVLAVVLHGLLCLLWTTILLNWNKSMVKQRQLGNPTLLVKKNLKAVSCKTKHCLQNVKPFFKYKVVSIKIYIKNAIIIILIQYILKKSSKSTWSYRCIITVHNWLNLHW